MSNFAELTEQEKWLIARILGINNVPETFADFEAKLNTARQSSIYLIDSIRGILARWEQSDKDLQRVSSGLIKADVLEWKVNASCGLEKYRWQLKWELGNALGIEVKIPLPFSVSETPLTHMNYQTYGQFYRLR